jgi:hypothetical protein
MTKEESKQVIEAVGYKQVGMSIMGMKQLSERVPEKSGLIVMQGLTKLAGAIAVAIR